MHGAVYAKFKTRKKQSVLLEVRKRLPTGGERCDRPQGAWPGPAADPGPSMHTCTWRKRVCQCASECAVPSRMFNFNKMLTTTKKTLKSLWLLFEGLPGRSMSSYKGNTVTQEKILKGSLPRGLRTKTRLEPGLGQRLKAHFRWEPR